jgi:chromosome segregation ATPase
VVRSLLPLFLIISVSALAAEPVLKAEAHERIRKNLIVLNQNIDRARKNLAAATHNLDVLSSELGTLDRLQKEHESLRAKYQNVDEKGADAEKTRALLKGIEEGLGEIETHRVQRQRQIKTWKERQQDYEAKLAQFEKKREELEAPPQLLVPDGNQR